MKLNSMHRQSLIEDEADLLLALLGGSPARTGIGAKDGFDGKGGILRRDFDGRDLCEIHPPRATSSSGKRSVRTDNSFSHVPILSEALAFVKNGSPTLYQLADQRHRLSAPRLDEPRSPFHLSLNQDRG
jgi:hypothetical protein